MRRILSVLAVALLVVCAQQAALVHEIGHGLGHGSVNPVAAATIADSQDPGAPDKGSYCEKCFQFAHVSSAAAGFSPLDFVIAGSNEPASDHPAAVLAADAPQSRSRGPPDVL
jgi:hypothetical protein